MNMIQYPVTQVLPWEQQHFPSKYCNLSIICGIYGSHKIAGAQNTKEVLQNQP